MLQFSYGVAATFFCLYLLAAASDIPTRKQMIEQGFFAYGGIVYTVRPANVVEGAR